ncbi:MAG: metal transporter [bacterium]|nr:metal transporter [bacterium]
MQKHKTLISAVLPLLLLGMFIYLFVRIGPAGVFVNSVAPIESLFIERVVLSPEHLQLTVLNDGPEPVTIAQTLVNNAYWKFGIEPMATLEPLRRAVVDINYPWVEGEPLRVALLTSLGTPFEHEVAVAVVTPGPDGIYVRAFVLLGMYVGVIPVLLGLLWLPFLRRLRERWYSALLAFTVGLLVFLGVDALAESFDLAGELPAVLNGIGILVIGFALSTLALATVSYKTEHLRIGRDGHTQALTWGYLIALGIGIHNLGEGLAIGSAYALGEVALGSALVIGFMAHNLTEGVAIVAPLARTIQNIKSSFHHIVLMGLAAGMPTIAGTLIGGFAYSTILSLFFLAIGAGAIFEVSFDILRGMKGEHRWLTLFSLQNMCGFLLGLLVIYVTGLLVA